MPAPGVSRPVWPAGLTRADPGPRTRAADPDPGLSTTGGGHDSSTGPSGHRVTTTSTVSRRAQLAWPHLASQGATSLGLGAATDTFAASATFPSIDEEWHQRWIDKRRGRILRDSHGEQHDQHSRDESQAAGQDDPGYR